MFGLLTCALLQIVMFASSIPATNPQAKMEAKNQGQETEETSPQLTAAQIQDMYDAAVRELTEIFATIGGTVIYNHNTAPTPTIKHLRSMQRRVKRLRDANTAQRPDEPFHLNISSGQSGLTVFDRMGHPILHVNTRGYRCSDAPPGLLRWPSSSSTNQ
ncbi:hypothetical protein BT63DRAFT_455576 [Microthyrium microscopicum]|uniref:Uncharacterized protein n=1 Tax=Microthyrium microscopicum TaxID=703497 RepID=A0A6A6UD93_9PEZI|nr:hypothetical protein BT63DRAFT_455576 [Microthyrium microscopicum]